MFFQSVVMIINFKDLNDKNYERKNIDIEIEKDKFYDGSEMVKYSKSIKFNGFLRRKKEVIELVGDVDTEVLLNCSRCTKAFSYEVKVHIEEEISNTDDCEIISTNTENIDIYEIIENSILLELPVKRLCKEDCKGLCQTCGKDLNLGQCSCTDFYVDPRLEKLSQMFSNHKEV